MVLGHRSFIQPATSIQTSQILSFIKPIPVTHTHTRHFLADLQVINSHVSFDWLGLSLFQVPKSDAAPVES